MIPRANLAEAREAAERVRPFMSCASIWDHLNLPERLPIPRLSLFETSSNPPIVELPTAVLKTFEEDPSRLPDSWLPSFLEYIPRIQRARSLTSIYNRFISDNPTAIEFANLDGIVAGLLLLLLDPAFRSPLRGHLFEHARQHKFGLFLAAQGTLLEEEQLAILSALSSEALYLRWLSAQQGWDGECAKLCQGHLNLDAGILMLAAKQSKRWLDRLIESAHDRPDAASAALVLQPHAPAKSLHQWIATLRKSNSARLAYLSARYARHTWRPEKWQALCAELKECATGDKAQFWYLWYSQIVGPEEAQMALRVSDTDLLWRLELLHALKCSDWHVRYNLGEKLGDPCLTAEASAALDWLNSR